MTLPRFDVFLPDSIEEACQFLTDYSDQDVRVLAGGTDLLVDLKRPLVRSELYPVDHGNGNKSPLLSTHSEYQWNHPESIAVDETAPGFLVSLHKIDALKKIEILEDGRLQVGALVTARMIQQSKKIRERWPALAEGADSLGSPLVRARGTLGGNLCNARPAADMVIPTICLNAGLTLQSHTGKRTIRSAEFITGPGKTVKKPDEILVSITCPASSTSHGSAYYKLAQRKALDISVVGVASWVLLGSDGTILESRVTLGAVGPKPLIATSVEIVLKGQIPSEALLAEASRAAAGDATPIDDHRGGAEYRREMVEVLTWRTLKLAIQRAGGQL